jgi:hypothetical protein
MLWFFSRDNDSLRLETRYDNDTLEYVGLLTHPDGRHESKRFTTVDAFRDWLVTLEDELAAEHWTPTGAPHVLPDGWPTRKPPR